MVWCCSCPGSSPSRRRRRRSNRRSNRRRDNRWRSRRRRSIGGSFSSPPLLCRRSRSGWVPHRAAAKVPCRPVYVCPVGSHHRSSLRSGRLGPSVKPGADGRCGYGCCGAGVPAAQLREARLAQGFAPFAVFVIVDFTACVTFIEDAAGRTRPVKGWPSAAPGEADDRQTRAASPAMRSADHPSIQGHFSHMPSFP